MAASLYFIIFTAITLVHDARAAASDDTFVDASCMVTSVKRVCDATLSPDSCYVHFKHMIESNVTQSQTALKNSIRLTMEQLSKASLDFAVDGAVEILINSSKPNNGLALSALGSCRELLSLAMDNLNKSLSCSVQTAESRGNLMSWLCATSSDLQTCVDGFDDLVRGVRNYVFEKLKTPLDQTTNSSTIMALIHSCCIAKTDMHHSRDNDYPSWLSSEHRRILQGSKINANVVVAKDGSGDYQRVSDAVKAAPRLSKNRFAIYVKKGFYHENVKVEYDQWNVMMFGDGMSETIIYSNLSYGGGLATLDTATFSK